MLNQFSLRSAVLQKELDMIKRENMYLGKQNEIMEADIERLESTVENLEQKLVGFDEFLKSSEKTHYNDLKVKEFIMHLQSELSRNQKQLNESETELRNVVGLLTEERDNQKRYFIYKYQSF